MIGPFARYLVRVSPPTVTTDLGKDVVTYDPQGAYDVAGCWISVETPEAQRDRDNAAPLSMRVTFPYSAQVPRLSKLAFEYGGDKFSDLVVRDRPRRLVGPVPTLDRLVVSVEPPEEGKPWV